MLLFYLMSCRISILKLTLSRLGRTYNPELRNTVAWLLTPAEPSNPKKIEDFVSGISGHVIATLDNNFQQNDTLTSELAKELESSRLFRLIAKLGTINERAEFENDQLWSETGPRYMLKLFRDFVFHQVDGNGKPVVDMAHILRSLNKLDAGIEERITLMSRDEQTVMVVTYKELKKEVTAAFADLQKQPAKGRY
jgi:PAB-dependent poly(A)-specific ribonuclease subunit 3